MEYSTLSLSGSRGECTRGPRQVPPLDKSQALKSICAFGILLPLHHIFFPPVIKRKRERRPALVGPPELHRSFICHHHLLASLGSELHSCPGLPRAPGSAAPPHTPLTPPPHVTGDAQSCCLFCGSRSVTVSIH